MAHIDPYQLPIRSNLPVAFWPSPDIALVHSRLASAEVELYIDMDCVDLQSRDMEKN